MICSCHCGNSNRKAAKKMRFLNSILFIIILSLTINKFVLHVPSVAATDVLSHGDELNSLESSSTLVSANGIFTLGFFTLYDTYLGIWYNDNDETKVWVANRDIPMSSSGSLVIDDSGTLKVIRRGGKFTNTTIFNVSNDVGSGNTRAVLKDSGNLVVYDVKSNRTLWQSFDHPTDILLPGMKLGYNLTTRQNWTLTSWLTDMIPAPGAFTLRLESDHNSTAFLVIYRRGKVYWSDNLYNFELFTYGTLRFSEILVSDASGIYITIDTDSISVKMMHLSSMGELFDDQKHRYSPSFCYGYQSNDGCAVSALPNCRGRSDSIQLESGKWEGDFIEYDDSSNISLADCMQRCWNDCNCKGFSTNDINGTGCFTWGGDAQFILDQEYETKDGVLISQKPLKNVLIEGEELAIDSTLVSAGGNFTLGFFTLQNFTYLGIWYTDDQDRKIWVANRDTPMTCNGSLIIDSATLKVIRWLNITMVNVSNHSVDSGNTKAILEDSGNFVLYDDVYKKKQILWQSFDQPTNTLLPRMKLGYNLTTRKNWTLTSWLSDDKAPASGAFILTLERIQNSPQLVIYRRGKVYWSSGSWVDKRLGFEFLHSSISTFGTGILISDSSGMYFSIQRFSEKSMMQLSSMGTLTDGGKNILTPTFCYGYESHDGCAISSLPNCRGETDSFQFENGIWDGDLIHNKNSSNISLNDCMERCWKDCNCKGFSTDGTGCSTWGKNALFHPNASISTQTGVLISLKPPKKKTWIWILVSVVILLTTALTTYLCYRRRLQENQKKKRDDYIHQLTGSASFNYGDELEKNIKDAPDVKIFSLKAILTATNNFSNENKLGQGGYGPVYKGKLFDGRQIAVKRLSKTSGQGIEEFKNELILISKLQHTNLVRLYGCCIHQEEKMLIYEFMPNKSLDFFLFGAEDQKKTINWEIRFNIIEGVAQGLLYLHKYSRMKVIHRDLKVSNVLLDNNMNPKIADFGMARIFQQNVTEAITNRVVGTYGYMAPEYAMRGTFSIKSDVFSFGVLILEIVSGKKNSSFYSLNRALNLLGYAWELWKGHASLELKDESLGESYDLKQFLRTIHVGLLCVQENADDRPTMPTVISMLNNQIADLPNPKQPAFLTSTPLVEAADQNIQGSVNGLTITMMEAR